jgi:hypothetical protein
MVGMRCKVLPSKGLLFFGFHVGFAAFTAVWVYGGASSHDYDWQKRHILSGRLIGVLYRVITGIEKRILALLVCIIATTTSVLHSAFSKASSQHIYNERTSSYTIEAWSYISEVLLFVECMGS